MPLRTAQRTQKTLYSSSPQSVDDIERAVLSKRHLRFSPPQCGACRRILHDARRELSEKYAYPSLTQVFQHEMLRIDLLMTFFDIT